MKKVMAIILAAVMLITLAGCGQNTADEDFDAIDDFESSVSEEVVAPEPIELIIYSPGGENSVPTKTIIKYAQLVEEASEGSIKMKVLHSNELGNDAEAIKSTRMGKIDIIFAGTSGFASFYDKAKIFDLPFLFDSAEKAYEVVNSNIGEAIFADFPKYGLIFLAEGNNGMRHISTTNRPVHTADDVKDLKIRVPKSDMYIDCWKTLEATPVALALDRLTPALANGIAEAQDNAAYHIVANNTYGEIKYFSNINYMWMGCTMAANAVSWNKLSEDQQRVLKIQAIEAAKYSFDAIAHDNEIATQTLQDAGVEFDFSPDIQSFKDKLGGAEYYKRYANEPWYDQAIIDSILSKE